MNRGPAESALELARASGLVTEGEPMIVLLSGGADSVCLLDVTLELGARTFALHVNHGLREQAEDDERFCERLCERLGVDLHVERARPAAADGPGNVQAQARELRYAHAERLARERGCDYATAHTLSDQAETVLYRLATSPGSRGLHAMSERRGRLVRPLLAAPREQTRAWCEARGLDWREDAANTDPRYARVRVRKQALPILRELNPGVERTLAETAAQLREEAELLDRAVDDALGRLGGAGATLSELAAEPPALQRLVLRRLAEAAAGRPHALARAEVGRIMRLGERGGSAALDLGGGLRAVVEYGVVRFSADLDPAPPEPVRLFVPGSARFGAWEVEARRDEGDVLLAADELGAEVIVRAWREGDRMRPAGLGGVKTLQDLFTDRKVPRALRRTLPVVEAGGEIAWVAGVAVGERFAADSGEDPEALIGLSARQPAASGRT